MDKNAIKKYAVWARRELIARVSQRAEIYDITADADTNASSINGLLLSDEEKKQRRALIEQVKLKGLDQVIEEVAYTWFNRFIALRFMEVNGYLPTHIRVFTDDNNAFKPQILAEAIHLELDGIDMEKVYEMKNNNENDELYKYLIIIQCNDLCKILPGMFQRIADYSELLFPDNILREGSVIEQMIAQIDEKDWDISEGGQIEILGWLYQFYISEKHEAVVDPLHGKVVNKDEVPAATALFTTDWVVRYIIDNSVGRYWIERNPESNLKNELEYFVIPKDGNIPVVEEKITPEELTVLDPSMGSAHFGVYAFDVLMKIYMEYGVSERDAAASIVEKNLFGLDIDDRSAQIAYFAIMMKARQHDRRFFARGLQPHFYSIQESNNVDRNAVEYFANGDVKLKKYITSILQDFEDAKEYGSIIQVEPVNFDALFNRFAEIEEDININKELALVQLRPLVQVAKILSNKYAVVATNPPYMNKYDAKLKVCLNERYKDYSGDLFSVFIYRNFYFCKDGGYSGFMTPFVWMFLQTYEVLRQFILKYKHISSLIQFEYSAFKDATVPICSFVIKNGTTNEKGYYFRLSNFTGGMDIQREKILEAQFNKDCGYYYETDQSNFMTIPNTPIAYWLSDNFINIFNVGIPLSSKSYSFQGIITGNNNVYLRSWSEISFDKFYTDTKSYNEHVNNVWVPYNKGGDYRKWYGDNYYVLKWINDGKGLTRARTENSQYHFRAGVTWTSISSGDFSCRYFENGFLSDSKGSSVYSTSELSNEYICAFMNSKVANEIFKATNPTISYQVMNILALPYIDFGNKEEIQTLSIENINLTKIDWDSYEISWDFKAHPLVTKKVSTIEEAFDSWSKECEERFYKLKRNEEKINQFFIEGYGLAGEMTPEVEEKNISIRKADLVRDIKSFISYAVGCMFGRYSLDESGVVFAGQQWDELKYKTFAVDKDGILPVCDDYYFEDDITERFIKFVEVVFGTNTLEENLTFIAKVLGNGNPREVIRNYFCNNFFDDHCSAYSITGSGKRPIYWLFDSGKKNGFKCLIYMHRYQPDTIARIRTDYVHEQQARYRTAIEETENRLLSASASDKIKLNKKLKHLKEQDSEIHAYEEKIHHLADQMIPIDLDDGVKVNYSKFQDVLAKIK